MATGFKTTSNSKYHTKRFYIEHICFVVCWGLGIGMDSYEVSIFAPTRFSVVSLDLRVLCNYWNLASV